MLPELLSAVRSAAVKHQKPLLGSPWASPPDVSTAMERPTPILVGSMDAFWLADIFAGRRRGECTEGRRRSRTQLLFLRSLFLRGGHDGSTRLYRPVCDPAPGSHPLPLPPFTDTTIYTPGPVIHLRRTLADCTWHWTNSKTAILSVVLTAVCLGFFCACVY